MPTPMAQIRGIGDPHVRSKGRHGPVNQRPVAANPPRQKCGVFIIGRHYYPVALEPAKVAGQSEGYSRSAARIRCVSHGILLQFRHESDAWIFNAPDLLRILVWTRHQGWFAINLPAIKAVSRACSAEMRQAASIFHSAKQQSRSIRKQRRTCIEYTVD